MVSYNQKIKKEVEIMDLIRYGEIIKDTETIENGIYKRVRLIKYNNELYLHAMQNGEIKKIKKIKKST